jgi:predicted ferric reductase
MRPITSSLVILLVLVVGLWFLSDTLYSSPFDYCAFRDSSIQLTGIIAIGAMCVGTLLAARPRWIEPYLEGLDKMYLLHKWLGITALVASVLHWWMASGSRMFLSSGAPSGGGPPQAESGEQAVSLIASLRGPAHPIGEWAFYISVVLIAAALIKRVPYSVFAKTHMLITAVFLALVFHSVILAKESYWAQPIGWLLFALVVAGVLGAIVVLARRFGAMPHAEGAVESQTYYPELRVLEAAITLGDGWKGHEAGQFAFVTTTGFEGAHPFTIASAWHPKERRIVLIAKELGDYTARLRDEFKVGQKVHVEGPYGRFNFDDAKPTQIWVGAGVGITPFVARMKHLARNDGGQTVHLFHSTADVSDLALQKMREDAKAANVKLYLTLSQNDPKLDGEKIRGKVPDWRGASIWFCGPMGFGASLRKDFLAQGLSARDFHQERFEMR